MGPAARSWPTASRRSCPPGDLTVIVNTGDDTERHGLLVMPDHDAVMYMLAERFDFERGWGHVDETWTVMDGLAEYGEEAWFRLGDRDFATHIARTARIREGRTLTDGRALAPGGARHPDRRSCRWPTSRSAPRSAPTRAGSTSRSTSSTGSRRPEVREIRFDGIDLAPTAEVVAALDGGRRHRHRAVEPDRVDRADPGRCPIMTALIEARAGAGVPVVAVSRSSAASR